MENLSPVHPVIRRLREGAGKLRRLWLCHVRPSAVERSIARRKGACKGCGECCDLLFHCPYLGPDRRCTIYDRRFKPCSAYPIDERDVRDIDCGFYFEAEGAEKRLFDLPLAPWASRELGLSFLAFAVGAGAGLAVARIDGLPAGYLLVAAFAAAFAFALFFFRNPRRAPFPGTEAELLAPADGRVTDVTAVEEPEFLGGPAVRVGIFMSLFDVHVNRAPATGRLAFFRHRDGTHGNVLFEGAWEKNENVLAGLETAQGPVAFRLTAGAVARRIAFDPAPGAKIRRGHAVGMVKFGSRAEVLVPAEAGWVPAVAPGTRVKAGRTVLFVPEAE